MIYVSIPAQFMPRYGRFTEIANIGDINVTIEFVQVLPSAVDLTRWRLNGTGDYADYFRLDDGLPYHTIIGELLLEDGGVYEIQEDQQRGTGRGGLIRLIVRGKLM